MQNCQRRDHTGPSIRLIIWRREPESAQSQGSIAADFSRHPFPGSRDGAPCVRGRFWSVPLARGRQSESLRFGGRQSLLRCTAEEWEDAIHLRPARTRDLCERPLSALWHAALLVSEPASGAEDGHLEVWARLLSG